MSLGQQKFTCRIELSKTEGITISILDLSQPTEVYRQVIFEGESLTLKTKDEQSSTTVTHTKQKITTEVRGAQGSTKIEQDPENVTVTCKSFRVNAENIALASSKDTKAIAKGSMALQSTGDFSAETKANCELTSKARMTIDATSQCAVRSKTQLSLEAPKVDISADASLEAKASGALNLRGGAVSVKGDMRAELDSPNTTVGSTMTTVKGQIVSVTGSLVKLG